MTKRIFRLGLFLILLSGIWANTAASAERTAQTLWDLKKLAKPPKAYPAPDFKEEGLKSLFYEGLPWQGRPTRIFAWYGVPQGTRAKTFPAMVLVHGGGGTAFTDWVRLWNQRGYAAIAMDTCGSLPVGEAAKHPRHEFGGPAGWGGFDKVDSTAEDQWPYHAVADVILAQSLLRSFPEIDSNRIGVTGISWGGFLASIVAGVDNRFKFAVPVYGCGFIGEDSLWLPTFAEMGTEKATRWLKLWDPSVYLKSARMPMLWVTGTNDGAYPLGSWQKSYRLPHGPRTLTLRVRMPHGHAGLSKNAEEIHAFADYQTKKTAPLARIVRQGRSGDEAWVKLTSKAPIVKAELNFTRDLGVWKERRWDTLAAQADPTGKKVTVTLPHDVTAYYFNLMDDRGLIVSSEHVETKQK